jgi:hypothetical protein
MKDIGLEQIPVIERLKYSLLSTPGTLKFFTRCFIGIATGKGFPRNLKHGDTFITKDGIDLTFDSCECSIASENAKPMGWFFVYGWTPPAPLLNHIKITI